MLYQIKYTVKALLLSTLLILPFASAQAVILNTWNDVDLNASGDFVAVSYGDANNTPDIQNAWFSMQWGAGTNNTLGAQGIDQVYYNTDTYVGVAQIWTGSIGFGTLLYDASNPTASSWQVNKATTTSGGGFGDFISMKNQDPASTDGISNTLYFVLAGVANFTPNAGGSHFSAHVRYEQNCSGWVADGTTSNRDSGSCGSSTTVPEPGSLALLGLGLFVLGMASRRKI